MAADSDALVSLQVGHLEKRHGSTFKDGFRFQRIYGLLGKGSLLHQGTYVTVAVIQRIRGNCQYRMLSFGNFAADGAALFMNRGVDPKPLGRFFVDGKRKNELSFNSAPLFVKQKSVNHKEVKGVKDFYGNPKGFSVLCGCGTIFESISFGTWFAPIFPE